MSIPRTATAVPPPLARLGLDARALAGPVVIAALAVALRVYRLELQAWNPDTYEQMAAASRLVAGDLPLSRIYPPGVAATLAPAFVLFPDTLATTQAVIIGMSLVLVGLAYAWSRLLHDDARVALLAAFLVAAMPQFVYFSRDGLFDVIGTTYLMAAVLLAPRVRDRGPMFAAVYGVLLALTVNVRATNAGILPAVAIYAFASPGAPRRLAPFAVAVGVMTALTLAGAVAGGWLGNDGGGAMTLAEYPSNVWFYARAISGGPLYAIFLLPLAVAGAVRLWRRERAFVLACAYVIVAWPLLHAPFEFANTRYMLAPLFLVLVLSASGAAAMLLATADGRPADMLRWLAAAASALLIAAALFGGAVTASNWPRVAAGSDEAAFRELRPEVAAMPDDALLAGAWLRGVRSANSEIEHLDLIDHSMSTGITVESAETAVERIAAAVAAGRPVYYLHSRAEADEDNLGRGGPGFDVYFDAIDSRFELTLIEQTSVDDFRLYRIER